MTVSLRNRNISDVTNLGEKLHGVPPDMLTVAESIDLSHNHISSLQRSFTIVRKKPEENSNSKDRNHRSREKDGNNNNNETSPTSALAPLVSLKHLLLSHNALRSLVGVTHTLTTLLVPYNTLESLVGLEGCTALRYLDVRYNKLKSLKGLPYQSDLSLSESPIQKGDGEEVVEAGRGAGVVVTRQGAYPPRGSDRVVTSMDEVHIGLPSFPELRTSASENPYENFSGPLPPLRHDGITLIASYNELRGPALRSLWSTTTSNNNNNPSSCMEDTTLPSTPSCSGVDASAEGEEATSVGKTRRMRPWRSDLIYVDLSHNKIEDMESVYQLIQSLPSSSRLECLKFSYNPLLINGSLFAFAMQQGVVDRVKGREGGAAVKVRWDSSRLSSLYSSDTVTTEEFEAVSLELASSLFHRSDPPRSRTTLVEYGGGEEVVLELAKAAAANGSAAPSPSLFTSLPPRWSPPTGTLERHYRDTTIDITQMTMTNRTTTALPLRDSSSIHSRERSSPVPRQRTASPPRDQDPHPHSEQELEFSLSEIASVTDALSSSIGFVIYSRSEGAPPRRSKLNSVASTPRGGGGEERDKVELEGGSPPSPSSAAVVPPLPLAPLPAQPTVVHSTTTSLDDKYTTKDLQIELRLCKQENKMLRERNNEKEKALREARTALERHQTSADQLRHEVEDTRHENVQLRKKVTQSTLEAKRWRERCKAMEEQLRMLTKK